jgi:transglutaminase-like putative cysteine protease
MNRLFACLLSTSCVLMILPLAVRADSKFPVSSIPDELRKGMDAVIREDQTEFKILSKRSAIMHTYNVVTIFNSAGNEFVTGSIGYNKLTSIKDLSANVYDAQGKLIKKLKGSEIHDLSAYDGFSLYSDNRFKQFDLELSTYPYTVEIEYYRKFNYLYFIPDFTSLPEGKVASQHAVFSLTYPADQPDLRPRFVATGFDQAPREVTTEGYSVLTWTFENLKPSTPEPYGPPLNEISPFILTAPNHFEYSGYEGSMSSWNDYGQWMDKLLDGRKDLSETTRKKILDLTAGMQTTEEKIKAIYEYMQNRTRYVSIQLGIGGLQPFEASVVDETGYGDCKALSNYMVSMLAVAGIKANYVLIRSGKDARKMNVDFPSHQFDHVVAFAPNEGDTIWMECTSQTIPLGYMGRFTGDRKALAITENGAQIVWTPKYSEKQNIQSQQADVVIDLRGNATAKIKTTYSGLQFENGGLAGLQDNQYDEQKKWIERNTNIPSFDVNSFSITKYKARIPSAVVKSSLTLNKVASVSGKRLFLVPNLLNRWTSVPEKVEDRKTRIIIRRGYTDLDTIRYQVPEEIYPEYLPEPAIIKSPFGEYESRFALDQGRVVYYRKLVIRKGEFPPASYNDMIDFYKKVSQADNVKIVFLNKT